MRRVLRVVAVIVGLSATSLAAADWPSIYGPTRDNVSAQKGLLRTWPAAGPPLLWTVPVGPGFGGPAVAGGKVYILDRDEAVGDTLRVFDLASGKEEWKYAYPAAGQFMFPGSRTTPTVDGNLVYTSGPLGDLHAIDIKTRKPVWRKNIWKEFGGGELPRWAVVQNPLIHGNLLIVAPQTPQAGVVAYDKVSGALKWKSEPLTGLPGYVSPQVMKIGGVDHVVMVTASVGRGRNAKEGVVAGLDPASGRTLWTYGGWQCAIPAPQPVAVGDGRILITGGYGAGTAMIKVEKKADGSYAATELYKNPDFGAHTQPPILFGDHFYSHFTVNERSDGLTAMSLDGTVKWKTDTAPPFTRGGAILADGLLISTDGDTKLYLIEPNPQAFKPLASVTILEKGDNWAPLALVDGTLIVRGQKEMKAFKVAS